MSELVVTLVRLGFLVLLWLLVLSAIGVLRRDISGTRVLARGSLTGRSTRPAESGSGAAGGRTGRTGRPGRSKRDHPTRLVVTAGPLTGTTLRLGENSILLGRSPSSTLVLDDDYSSNRHARIFPSEGGWFVEDLGSTNGTYLGNSPVQGPTAVPVGTPIRVGQTVIELLR